MGFLCCSLLEAIDPLSEEFADILPCTVAKEVGKEREEGGLDRGDIRASNDGLRRYDNHRDREGKFKTI